MQRGDDYIRLGWENRCTKIKIGRQQIAGRALRTITRHDSAESPAALSHTVLVEKPRRRPCLYEAGFLEREERSALLHCLQAFGGYADSDLLPEFRDKECFRLEVDLATAFAGGVEFGRADAVGVPTADLGVLACNFTNLCHIAAQHSTW